MATERIADLGGVRDVAPDVVVDAALDRRNFCVVVLMTPMRLGTRHFMGLLEYKYFTPHIPEREKNLRIYTLEWEGFGWSLLVMPAYMKNAAKKVAQQTYMKLWDGVPTRYRMDGVPIMHSTRNKRGPGVSRFPLDLPNVWTLEYNIKTHPLHVEPTMTRERILELVREEDEHLDEIYRAYGMPGHRTVRELDAAIAAYEEVKGMEWPDKFGEADAERYADELITDWPDVIKG